MGGYAQAVQEERAAKLQQRNAKAALYLNAVNTELPPSTVKDASGNPIINPAYQQALDARTQAMKDYIQNLGPEQHASFGQHVHGLIFGQPEAAQPVHGNAPEPAAAPPAPAATPQPQSSHPFASNPVYAKIQEGLESLGKHLKAGAHPLGPQAQPDYATLAKNYRSPEDVQLATEARQKATDVASQELAHKYRLEEIQAKPGNLNQRKFDVAAQALGYTDFDDPKMTEADAEKIEKQVGSAGRAPKLATRPVVDEKSPTGFSAATWDETSGQVLSVFPGVLPPRGFIPTERVSSSTDQFGNTTSSVSKVTPQVPGVAGRPVSSNAPKVPVLSTINSGIQAANASSRKLNKGKPVSTQAPVVGPKQLDADGKIPEGVGNPQVREAAQQLLDDRDVDKIPTKAREPAAALARQYGWEQGKFTPKEQTLLKEATNFLREADNNPALSVLDDFSSRAKLSQLVQNPEKHGTLGMIATLAASGAESPQEAEFIRMYNQLVGTISGLSQLVRSGRATEAQIDRLKNELPNPLTTTSSSDAKARIKRLLEEVDIASQKGQFGGTQGTSGVIVVSPEEMK